MSAVLLNETDQPLYTEKGRHNYIARYNRLCKCCSQRDIKVNTTSFLNAHVI